VHASAEENGEVQPAGPSFRKTRPKPPPARGLLELQGQDSPLFCSLG